MIAPLSSLPNKKIFARATPQGSTMSRAKIAPAAARSDAVRGCSSSSLPARGNHPGPWDVAHMSFCRCTPARWMAGRLDRQCPMHIGSGVTVAAATALQPFCNREIVTIQYVNAVVARLQDFASRHVRVRAYVRLCAHMRGLISATLQPSLYLIDIARFVGCSTVAKRLQLQPRYAEYAQNRRNPPFLNKIGAGYGAIGAAEACAWPMKGFGEGRVGKSFGLGARGDRLGARIRGMSIGFEQVLDQVGGALGRIGGFLRVSRCASGRVGTGMLEHCAEMRGNAYILGHRRKLYRLTGWRAAAGGSIDLGADRQGGLALAERGAAPPRGAARSPSSSAHAIFPVSGDLEFARPAGVPKAREVWFATTGPGDEVSRPEFTSPMGWGVTADWGLCRGDQPSGRSARVN